MSDFRPCEESGGEGWAVETLARCSRKPLFVLQNAEVNKMSGGEKASYHSAVKLIEVVSLALRCRKKHKLMTCVYSASAALWCVTVNSLPPRVYLADPRDTLMTLAADDLTNRQLIEARIIFWLDTSELKLVTRKCFDERREIGCGCK